MTVLGDVAEIVDCEHKTAPENPNGEFFAVGTPAMRGNVIDYREARRIDEATFVAWTARITPKFGDILFAREAPVGPVVAIPKSENVAPGQRTVLIRPDEDVIDGRYLKYKLMSPEVQWLVQSLAAGSTVPHLNVSDIRELDIETLPSLDDQRSIADVLSALDDKIAANRRIAGTVEQLVVALVSQSSIEVPLGNLVDIVRQSITPTDMHAENVTHFSLPDFDVGRPSIVPPSTIKSSKNRITEPVVLVSKLNPRIPRIWPLDEAPAGLAVASTEFVALKPKDLPVAALWGALATPTFTTRLLSHLAGTTGSHQRVRPEQMLEVFVPDARTLPAEDLEAITNLIRLSNNTVHENTVLAQTRDELLPLLMSGKITVRDAEQATAAVL